MSDNIRGKLLGWPVFRPFRLTLAEQAYEILTREIHAGRWKPGDRLPSIVDLARDSGLGRGPIQRAFEQLSKAGYVRQQRRNGTTLVSPMPQGRVSQGVIGVLIESLQAPSPTSFGALELHYILQAALDRGLVTETCCLPQDADWSKVDRPGGLFSDRVMGIVALHSFARPWRSALDNGRLPLVFLLDPCAVRTRQLDAFLPHVTGDPYAGFCLLTRRVIEEGHREIALLPLPGLDADYTAVCWDGYAAAMREAGLTPNREAFEWALARPKDGLAFPAAFLQGFPAVTAAICQQITLAHALIAAADVMGTRVPRDLSVVAQGYGMMRPTDPSHRMTCLQYDLSQAASLCLDMLGEMRRNGVSHLTRAAIRPVISPGQSLGRLPAAPASSVRSASRRAKPLEDKTVGKEREQP